MEKEKLSWFHIIGFIGVGMAVMRFILTGNFF